MTPLLRLGIVFAIGYLHGYGWRAVLDEKARYGLHLTR